MLCRLSDYKQVGTWTERHADEDKWHMLEKLLVRDLVEIRGIKLQMSSRIGYLDDFYGFSPVSSH